jgi:hypothetical protein
VPGEDDLVPETEEIFPIISSSFPGYAEIVPCLIFTSCFARNSHGCWVVDDLVRSFQARSAIFPEFFLFFRKLLLETGSNPTASSASQSVSNASHMKVAQKPRGRAAASGGRRSHEDAAGRVYLANAFSCVHLQGETVSCG